MRVVIMLCAVAVTYGQSPEARQPQPELEAPLHHALRQRNYDAALKAMPLQRNIDAAAADKNGIKSTPLCLAVQDPSADAYDMVQALLLKYGADTNVRDGRGFTPLHHAAGNGNLAVVDLLLENGADVNAAIDGPEATITPLYMAMRFSMNRVAATLRLHGADELDDDLKSQLRVEAAIERARMAAHKQMQEDLPDNPADAVRMMYDHVSRAVVTELEALGRFDEAAIWRNFGGDQLAALISQDPPAEGVNPDAWIARTTRRLMGEIQSSIQDLDASSDAP